MKLMKMKCFLCILFFKFYRCIALLVRIKEKGPLDGIRICDMSRSANDFHFIIYIIYANNDFILRLLFPEEVELLVIAKHPSTSTMWNDFIITNS